MISGQVPSHLVAGARTGFLRAVKTENPMWQNIASTFTLDGKSADLVDLGGAPMPVNSRTGLTVQDFIERSLTVTALDWDITVFISHNAMMDDRTSTLDNRVRSAGANFNRHMNALVFRALNAGDASTYGLTYDGLTFFNDAHKDPGAAYQTGQDNKFDLALDATNFETVYVAAQTYRDDQGEFVGYMPNLLVVPPQLKYEAAQLADNAMLFGTPNNDINPWSGSIRYIESPYLDSTAWFLVAASETIKPLMLVMREQPSLQSAWFDPERPDGGHYMFKFFARYNVAYGDWRLATMGKS